MDYLKWEWGHGGSITEGNAVSTRTPSHTFPTAGSYLVKLTASNRGGVDYYTTQQTIKVPSGTFDANYVYEASYTTLDVDASSSVASGNNISGYSWNWGDGQTTSDNDVRDINGSFDANLTGWSAQHATLTRDTVNFKSGGASAKVVSANTGRPRLQTGDTVPVTAAKNYKFSAWMKTQGTLSQPYALVVEWYTNAWGYVGESQSTTFTNLADWTKVSIDAQAPAGAEMCIVYVILASGTSSSTTDTIWVDEVQMLQVNGSAKFAQHIYSQGGAYTVTLTIVSALGQSNSESKTITVTDPPNPTLYFTTDRNLLEVDYSPSKQDGSTYLWNFGDGQTSTVKNVTHTYATSGVYSVTLTVNGTLTTTQDVAVYEASRPIRTFGDALRLEVQQRPGESVIWNRLPNPSGEKGSFGWSSPVAGSVINSTNTDSGPDDFGFGGWKLIYKSSGTGAQTFYSAPVKVTAGKYVAASWNSLKANGYYRLSIEALNASQVLLGTSTVTGYLQAPGTPHRASPYLLPAGTQYARLKVQYTSDTGTGVPVAGEALLFRRAMLATAATASELTNLSYTESNLWVDVLGPTHEITITREPLDISTLNASITDADLDPAVSATIRPGQGLRLRTSTEDDAGNAVWESVYEGTISNADVSYEVKKTRIKLTALDNITALAQVTESRGVASISDLPDLLEGTTVPYLVNGSGGQIPSAQVVAVNDDASLLDQIALARDTDLGYVHVNRNNILVANDPANVPSAVVAVLDETAYSDIDATFGFTECINSVTIKFLRYDSASGETKEVPYGPYEDLTSIDEWGLHAETFTIQGVIENPVVIEARAQDILNANAQPRRRVNSLTIPIRTKEDLTRSKALLDLMDLVQVAYSRTETDDLVRIVSLKHTITPKKWRVEVGFNADGTVARPVATPSPIRYVDVAGLAIEIPNSANLNNYVTPGTYAQSSNVEAAAGTNYPQPLAGLLRVDANTDQSMVWQDYRIYNGGSFAGETYTRTRWNGTWSAWQYIGPKPSYSGQAVASAAVTGLAAGTVYDVPGATLTVPVKAPTDVYLVSATFDIQNITTTGGNALGRLNVNGVVQTAQAVWDGGTVSGVCCTSR